MSLVTRTLAGMPIAAALIAGSLSLGGCATREYVDEHIAAVNTRIDGVDAKASDALRRADAANAAAQAAAADAQRANERIDQLSTRIDSLGAQRRPRG